MTFNISKLGLVRKNQLINANLKKYISLYFARWHIVSLRSVVFSGRTSRYEGRKTSASNLLLFQWASKPTLNAITSSCFAEALDSTTLSWISKYSFIKLFIPSFIWSHFDLSYTSAMSALPLSQRLQTRAQPRVKTLHAAGRMFLESSFWPKKISIRTLICPESGRELW